MKLILILVLTAVGYSVFGTAAGLLWQRLSSHRIPQDDLWAIAMLWWTFLPLGLALALVNYLQDRFGDATLFN